MTTTSCATQQTLATDPKKSFGAGASATSVSTSAPTSGVLKYTTRNAEGSTSTDSDSTRMSSLRKTFHAPAFHHAVNSVLNASFGLSSVAVLKADARAGAG